MENLRARKRLKVFVLELGKAVKIFDLTQDRVRLSGHCPDSMRILGMGSRPGEKLYEELSCESEEFLPAKHRDILFFDSRMLKLGEVGRQIEKFLNGVFGKPEQFQHVMQESIPAYVYDRPDNNNPLYANPKLNRSIQ